MKFLRSEEYKSKKADDLTEQKETGKKSSDRREDQKDQHHLLLLLLSLSFILSLSLSSAFLEFRMTMK